MLEITIGLLGVLAGFASAWYGVVGSAKRAEEQNRRQKAEADAATKEAYLRHLQEEFSANRRLMAEIKTYIDGGPAIEEILAPEEAASVHLRFTAWDALVRAGVLSNLAPSDQHLFRVADRAGRKSAQDIQTLASNWRRSLAWERWKAGGRKDQEVATLRECLRQTQRQIRDSLDAACIRTDEALTRLKELFPDNTEPPAT